MTTMSASLPPLSSTKRSRMRGLVSLSSAPPIGMIQPRCSPLTGLLGIATPVWLSARRLFERTTAREGAAGYMLDAVGEHIGDAIIPVQRHEVRVRPGLDPALAGQAQQRGDVAGERRQRVFQRDPAGQ